MSDLRVQFIHGLEGSPRGNKASFLAAHFDTRTPAMDASDFDACVEHQAEEIETFQPEVLVGSSFGGAVAMALLADGRWRGPTLLLAQAARLFFGAAALPPDVTVWLVHATKDDVVDVADSRQLARTGSPDRVRLIEVNDDHGLTNSVEAGLLLTWVMGVYAASQAP